MLFLSTAVVTHGISSDLFADILFLAFVEVVDVYELPVALASFGWIGFRPGCDGTCCHHDVWRLVFLQWLGEVLASRSVSYRAFL